MVCCLIFFSTSGCDIWLLFFNLYSVRLNLRKQHSIKCSWNSDCLPLLQTNCSHNMECTGIKCVFDRQRGCTMTGLFIMSAQRSRVTNANASTPRQPHNHFCLFADLKYLFSFFNIITRQQQTIFSSLVFSPLWIVRILCIRLFILLSVFPVSQNRMFYSCWISVYSCNVSLKFLLD